MAEEADLWTREWIKFKARTGKKCHLVVCGEVCVVAEEVDHVSWMKVRNSGMTRTWVEEACEEECKEEEELGLWEMKWILNKETLGICIEELCEELCVVDEVGDIPVWKKKWRQMTGIPCTCVEVVCVELCEEVVLGSQKKICIVKTLVLVSVGVVA